MNKSTVLIAADCDILDQNIKSKLRSKGWDLVESYDVDEILRSLNNYKIDIVIDCSAHRCTNDIIELTNEIRRHSPQIPIILITRYSSEELAIAALKAGVNDYFKVPFPNEAILKSIHQNLSETVSLNASLPESEIKSYHENKPMIGNSLPMKEIKEYLVKIAKTDCTVLITGETGTGKELVAELIHQYSPREKRPFICINCAALPESLVESEMFGYERGAFTGAVSTSQGKFEQANGGTVFLDEIADMSLYAQAKILRALENKKINRLGGNKVVSLDVRITAATNRDPEQLVEEGKFRDDLFYRLNVARIHLPPLRERKEDIPNLVNHTIRELNQEFDQQVEGLTDEAMESLIHYHWPGNVRELKNCLESTYINLLSRRISFMDFPDNVRKRLRFSEEGFTNERDMVLAALSSTNWNKTEAAKKLKWSRMKIYRTLKRHKINFTQEKP